MQFYTFRNEWNKTETFEKEIVVQMEYFSKEIKEPKYWVGSYYADEYNLDINDVVNLYKEGNYVGRVKLDFVRQIKPIKIRYKVSTMRETTVDKRIINGLKDNAYEFKTYEMWIEYWFDGKNIEINNAYIDDLKNITLNEKWIIINNDLMIKTDAIKSIYIDKEPIYEQEED